MYFTTCYVHVNDESLEKFLKLYFSVGIGGNILIFFDANGIIYSCCRITSSVVLLFTVATSTVLIVFYSMVIGNPDSLKVILSDIQLFAYQRHAHSLLISFVILNLSSILVGTLLILGKKLKV